MTTVNDIFTKALALYDEISPTGLVDPTKTADYRARTPFLADMLQKELWNTSDYTKIHEFSYTKSDTWTKITLPIKFKSVKDIVLSCEFYGYYPFTDYKLEKDGTGNYLYMKFPYDATVRVVYKPYPTDITAITDSLELDEITLQGVAYGLCKYFAMSEQNTNVAETCERKFQEIKSSKLVQPTMEQQIVDVY